MELQESGTQEELGKEEGLCFSYLFDSIIRLSTSVLPQWPKSLVPEVMVSGFYLFQSPSYVVVTFSIALEASQSWET